MNAGLRRWRHRATNRLVTALSTRPALYYPARRATGTFDDLCIRRDTELVLEGFPRSANSTTVHGFLERQERPVRVAHHKHHAAQLVRAAAWGIPAVALIRPPRDAIVSLPALAEEGRRRRGGDGGRAHSLRFEDVVATWVAFYAAVSKHRSALVVAPFTWATRDLTGLIEGINARFGTSFVSAETVRRPQPTLGWHARTNPLRKEIRDGLCAELRAAEATRPALADRLRDAQGLYHALVEPS